MRWHPQLADETGLLGKLAILWIVLAVLAGIAVMDTVSIVAAKIRLSNIAVAASSEGVEQFQRSQGSVTICRAAAEIVLMRDPDARITRRGCTVDATTGTITITVRTTADTILAGRLSITRPYTKIVESETSSPSSGV